MPPAVDFLGITIVEPTTTLTDYALAVVAWWLGARLLCGRESRQFAARRLWGGGLLLTGVAALLGGTSHGFGPVLEAGVAFAIWKGTVYAVGLSMLLSVAGTVIGTAANAAVRRACHALNVGGFTVFAAWMATHDAFVYVIYYYVPAMLLIAALQAWALYRHKAPSAPWLIGGVVLTLLGAIIQQNEFSLHPHFNQNDLFHLVQIAGLFLLFRGASRLRERSP